MSFGFKNTWKPEAEIDRIERAQREGLTAAAAEGEAILKSPAPTGWPRRTGFLANSSGHTEAAQVDGGWQSEVTVQAEYWPFVNKRTKTMERMGEAVTKALPDHINGRL